MTTDVVNSNPKGPVSILGEAYVGQTLIARPNSVQDADGIDWGTVSYQWLRDGLPIDGATSKTYDVSSDDVAAAISVQFIYTDFLGFQATVTSDPEDPVPPEGTPLPVDDLPYNPLMILGDAQVGEYLTARPNAVLDDNGIATESITFQWVRDGEIIPDATDQVYAVTQADLGAQLSVIYEYDDLLGTHHSLTSNPEPAVIPAAEPEPVVVVDTQDDCCLIGTSASDTLTASVGLKRISGLDDTDQVFFEGDQSAYTMVIGPDTLTLSQRTDGGLGTIELDDVELIDFGSEIAALSGPMDLTVFAGHTSLDRAAFEDIIEVYIAYFNRAPDAIGLSFWATAYANGTSLNELAALFSDQDETRGIYGPDSTNLDFATQVYLNVLGREADQAGLQFWVNALDGNTVSRDQFILKVLEGAKAEFKPENGFDFVEQQMADRAFLESKVDLGEYFSVHLGMSNVDHAAEVMALFDGSQTSLNDAIAATDAYYADALDPISGEFLMQLVGVIGNPFEI